MNVELFSGPQCSHCERAKTILKTNNIDFTEYDIAADISNQEDLFSRVPNIRALPQLFVDSVHIGSVEDLEICIEQGKFGKRGSHK